MLILTNSVDGTSDALSWLAAENKTHIFRFNVDLWEDYEITFTQTVCNFSDRTGRLYDLNNDNSFIIWRKPFWELAESRSSLNEINEGFALSNLRSFLSTLTRHFSNQGKVRLVEPQADLRLPKINQLFRAAEHFTVPEWEFRLNNRTSVSPPVITKALGNPGAKDGRIFYTTPVEANSLALNFPWFLQKMIEGGKDITCVYIEGKSRFFESDYDRQNGADWRVEINCPNQSRWRKADERLSAIYSPIVDRFMRSINLKYGRLDFIFTGSDLIFLEVNSNGEFGWLDDDSLTLHREFLHAAKSASSAIVI